MANENNNLVFNTPQDMIALALKDCGAFSYGQVPAGEDTSDALKRLNMLISLWRRKRWFIWHLVDLSVVSTGAVSYTIGPGGNINVPTRPDRIEAAFFRQTIQSQPSQIDYPLELLQSREDYNNIALKQLQSFSMYLFYDSAYPMGVLYPWPVMQASIYELHISVKDILPGFSSLADQSLANIPEEYQACLFYNLLCVLAPAYGMPIPKDVAALAKEALNTLRKANTQIARLMMPGELIRPGIYNPYSDQIR